MSKLPKPSGLRPPGVTKVIRPLEPIPESVLNINPTRVREIHTKILATRRRSKSFSDLRGYMEKPQLTKAGLTHKPFKTSKVAPSATTTTSKVLANGNSNNAPKGSKVTAAKKRVAEKETEGPTKAKMAKKIPDWDYKSRFNALSEKHKAVQDSYKELKDKFEVYETIEDRFDALNKEHEELQKQHTELLSKYKLIESREEKNIKEIENLQSLKSALEKSFANLEEQHNKLESEYRNLKNEFEKKVFETKDLSDKYKKSEEENKTLKETIELMRSEIYSNHLERKALHNTVQDLKGNIRVFCRVRPPINEAEQDKLPCYINFIDENGLEIRKSKESISQITGKASDQKGEFTFDRVFVPESTQEEVFEDLAQLVQSALDGYNVCVFAYGQTGSGKTFTMQGGEQENQRGMIPRAVDLIFERIAQLERAGWTYTVEASFLEIYNEVIRDLLNLNGSQKLEVYFNEGKGTTVTNLTIQPINSSTELKQLMQLAQRNRATAATDFNEHSSRSHAVTKIYLQGTAKDSNMTYSGSINLVDLAGSESAKTATNERLTETKNINKSLSTLGDVMLALHTKQKHIPYRNSKLTYLLQSSLGGNSKTLMFVNIAPFDECFGESLNSLRFASKVKEVKTGSKRNKITPTALC